MQKKFHQKAFTLIEMLIVIVIIGVLAAALIPRLTSVRDRANDVARKADLNQLATAIIARQMDHNGNLPPCYDDIAINTGCAVTAISGALKEGGLDGVPSDPKTDNSFEIGASSVTGEYGYLRMVKNSVANAAFAVMAKMETPGASNWLFQEGSNSGEVLNNLDAASVVPCKSMKKDPTSFQLNPGGECLYTGAAQLRYLLIR